MIVYTNVGRYRVGLGFRVCGVLGSFKGTSQVMENQMGKEKLEWQLEFCRGHKSKRVG